MPSANEFGSTLHGSPKLLNILGWTNCSETEPDNRLHFCVLKVWAKPRMQTNSAILLSGARFSGFLGLVSLRVTPAHSFSWTAVTSGSLHPGQLKVSFSTCVSLWSTVHPVSNPVYGETNQFQTRMLDLADPKESKARGTWIHQGFRPGLHILGFSYFRGTSRGWFRFGFPKPKRRSPLVLRHTQTYWYRHSDVEIGMLKLRHLRSF